MNFCKLNWESTSKVGDGQFAISEKPLILYFDHLSKEHL